ncbi:hypothetical protein BWR60_09605 [Inquilinus limosus]|uniref:Uncharacterized protein n=2 Tax=Inquilinus limosus TaxID=171674 RepID=A0A211ZQ95_9PROT|nr:hypothetical protein BWR60_09605 [Inquilinus limosus]
MRALFDPRITGQIAQGLTLGGADEALGGLAGMVTGRGYQAGVDTARQDNADFASDNPGMSMLAQLGGGAMLAAPVAGLVKAAPSLLGRVAQGVGLGTGAGAAGGFLSGEGGAENRLEGAATGGAVGGLLGGAIPATGALIRRSSDMFKTLFRTRPADEQANRLIAGAMRRDSLTPETATQAMDAAGSQPMTPADLGPNMQRLLGSAYRAPGEGRAVISEVLDARGALRPQRLGDVIRRSFGAPEDFYTTIDDLTQVQKAKAAPLYEKAFAENQAITNDRIQGFLQDPIMQQGIRKGLEIQRLEALAQNKSFNPSDYAITGFNEAGDPVIGAVPNMRLLDAAKRGLDDILEGYRDTTTGKLALDERGRAIEMVRKAYVKTLDDVAPAEYQQARAAWAGPAQSKEALWLGRSIARGGSDLEPLLRRFNGLSAGDKDMARLGVARQLAEMISRGTETRNQALGLLSPQMRGRLEPLFPDRQSYEALEDAVRRESQMVGTDRVARSGSQTAERLAEDADQISNLGEMAQAGEAVLSGSPIRMARAGIGIAARRAQGMDENVAREIGRRLLANDPQSRAQVMDELQRLMFTPKQPKPIAGLLGAAGRVSVPGLLGSRLGEGASR